MSRPREKVDEAVSAGLSITGPALVASETTTTTTTQTSQTLNHVETSVTTQTTIGPATILIGEEQSQTFFVPAGTININTNTHTESFVDRTTQDVETTLTSAHYELVGSGGSGPSCGPGAAGLSRQVAAMDVASAAAGTVPLLAALLPGSRSVKVGCPATAFVTVINTGAEIATGVGIALASPAPPTAIVYQTTNPLTNALTGSANVPVDIPAGQTQTFLVALTPTAPFGPQDVYLAFTGGNTAPVTPVVGLNTLLLAGASTATPDIVALGATVNNDGIVDLAGPSGAGAFAVASANVGAGGNITVSADTGGALLPVTIALCRTDPAGLCTGAPSETVALQIDAGATPTFAVFVQGIGFVAFDPARHRIFVRFKDTGGATRGSTSVAPRTQ